MAEKEYSHVLNSRTCSLVKTAVEKWQVFVYFVHVPLIIHIPSNQQMYLIIPILIHNMMTEMITFGQFHGRRSTEDCHNHLTLLLDVGLLHAKAKTVITTYCCHFHINGYRTL